MKTKMVHILGFNVETYTIKYTYNIGFCKKLLNVLLTRDINWK